MSAESASNETPNAAFKSLLWRVLTFMAVLIVGRFVLEVAGVPANITQRFSSTAGIFLAAIYLAAVGPLRGGMRKFKDLLLPAFLLSAWTVGCVVVLTVIAALLRIERSHFANPEDFGNWGELGKHLAGHLIELAIFFVLTLIIMAAMQTLWRWPVTVGPAAIIGVLVIMRFTLEAMGVDDVRTAPWSSTLGVFVSAIFLGAMAPRLGMTSSRSLLPPALAIAFAWRFWILLVTLLSALVPFFKTHFFDPTGGHVAWRLLRFFAGGVVMEGLIVGLLVWGIAVWISRATRPVAAA